MTESQKKQYFNVPDEYRDLFSKITDPFSFTQDKWYGIPKDESIREFLDWYNKFWGCIEFSETKTHFRVLFWPILRKPGVPLSEQDLNHINKKSSNMTSDQNRIVNIKETIDGL